jgi:hypothetical protein
MIIFFAVYISGILTESGKKEIEIEYTDYREYLLNKEIQKGVITGNTFHGEFKTPKTIETLSGLQLNDISYFKLVLLARFQSKLSSFFFCLFLLSTFLSSIFYL